MRKVVNGDYGDHFLNKKREVITIGSNYINVLFLREINEHLKILNTAARELNTAEMIADRNKIRWLNF